MINPESFIRAMGAVPFGGLCVLYSLFMVPGLWEWITTIVWYQQVAAVALSWLAVAGLVYLVVPAYVWVIRG